MYEIQIKLSGFLRIKNIILLTLPYEVNFTLKIE